MKKLAIKNTKPQNQIPKVYVFRVLFLLRIWNLIMSAFSPFANARTLMPKLGLINSPPDSAAHYQATARHN